MLCNVFLLVIMDFLFSQPQNIINKYILVDFLIVTDIYSVSYSCSRISCICSTLTVSLNYSYTTTCFCIRWPSQNYLLVLKLNYVLPHISKDMHLFISVIRHPIIARHPSARTIMHVRVLLFYFCSMN